MALKEATCVYCNGSGTYDRRRLGLRGAALKPETCDECDGVGKVYTCEYCGNTFGNSKHDGPIENYACDCSDSELEQLRAYVTELHKQKGAAARIAKKALTFLKRGLRTKRKTDLWKALTLLEDLV